MDHAGAAVTGFDQLVLAIEHSALGLMIRDAVLLYPVANVLHVLAVLVFFAAVAAMDMRILGLVRGDAISVTIARWRPIAILALLVLVPTGFILFVPEASAMVKNPSFRLKATLVLIGVANVLIMSLALRRHDPMLWEAPRLAKASAAASLAIWLAVAGAGRFIAYA